MVQPRTILVCDNERDLVDVISFNLQKEGYRTVAAYDGVQALEMVATENPDLVLLDIMMPRKSGTEVTIALRADPRTKGIPIIMLTAKTAETDAVVGYTLGADHYLRKPFGMKELIALVEASLRRAGDRLREEASDEPDQLTVGPVVLDRGKHTVTIHGSPVQLTLTEFRLLMAMMGAQGRVLSRNQLMDQALGVDVFVTDRTIDVHITALRRKLGEARDLIETVRGVGYRMRDGVYED